MIIFHELKLAVFLAPLVCEQSDILNLKDAGGVEEEDAFLKWKKGEDETEHYEVAVVTENPYVRLCRMYDVYCQSLRDRQVIPGSWLFFTDQVIQKKVEPYLRACVTDYLAGFEADHLISADDLYTQLRHLGVHFIGEENALDLALANTGSAENDVCEEDDYEEYEQPECVKAPVIKARDWSQFPITPQVRSWCKLDAETFGYAGQLAKNLPVR